MTKNFLFSLAFLFPMFLFGQSAFSDCNNVFTKVEILPSLKVSTQVFGDTLMTILKAKKFPVEDNTITYLFVVTKKSKIDNLVIDHGEIRKEKVLRESILKLAELWKPAMQNGYEVCAYVRLNLEFVDNKVNIKILPPQSLPF